MNGPSPTLIIIVDDSRAWALHVWRYLTATPGFGNATVGNKGVHHKQGWATDGFPFPDIGKGTTGKFSPLEADEGKLHFIWIGPDTHWLNNGGIDWSQFLPSPSTAWRIMALIDIRLKAEHGGHDQNRAKGVKEKLRTTFSPRIASSGPVAEHAEKIGSDPRGTPLTSPAHKFECWYVSSYHTKYDGGEVKPKSTDTLQELQDWLEFRPLFARVFARTASFEGVSTAQTITPPSTPTSNSAHATSTSSSMLHVLVTGAGFDLGHFPDKQDEFGAVLGMPFTYRLLDELPDPFFHQADSNQAARNAGQLVLSRHVPGEDVSHQIKTLDSWQFPLPVKAHDGRDLDGYRLTHLVDACEASDLDEWWQQILEGEGQLVQKKTLETNSRQRGASTVSNDAPQAPESSAATASLGRHKALEIERKLRESFRQTLLKYDWGHPVGNVAAATLPWNVWLSTNYTHFVDRAIDGLKRSESATQQTLLPEWRVISTVEEGRIFEQEEMDRWRRTNDLPRSVLIKLHGDLSHLHTIALATSDKDSTAPFMYRVDLSPLYALAEKYLLNEILVHRKKAICWHLVGHGMLDKQLNKLIYTVSRAVPAKHVKFILVNPHPQKPLEALAKAFADMGGISPTDFFNQFNGVTAATTGNKYMLDPRLKDTLRE